MRTFRTRRKNIRIGSRVYFPFIMVPCIIMILVCVGAIFLMLTSVLFSFSSPVMMGKYKASFVGNFNSYHHEVDYIFLIGEKVAVWKIENITFTQAGGKKECYGNLHFCRYEKSTFNATRAFVDRCVLEVKSKETVSIARPFYSGYPCNPPGDWNLMEDVNWTYKFEVFSSALFCLIIVCVAIIPQFCTIASIQVKGRKMYTLVKNSQIPRRKTGFELEITDDVDDGDENEPFIVHEANIATEKFGKILISTGVLIFPKMIESETLVREYALETNDCDEVDVIERKSGLWKCMASTARSENEKVIKWYSAKSLMSAYPAKYISSSLMFVLSVPLVYFICACVFVIFMFFVISTRILGLGPGVMTYYILMVACGILYVVIGMFELLRRIREEVTRKIFLTSDRIVIYSANTIRYLFYEDIKEFKISNESNHLWCTVNNAFLERMGFHQSTINNKSLNINFIGFVKYTLSRFITPGERIEIDALVNTYLDRYKPPREEDRQDDADVQEENGEGEQGDENIGSGERGIVATANVGDEQEETENVEEETQQVSYKEEIPVVDDHRSDEQKEVKKIEVK